MGEFIQEDLLCTYSLYLSLLHCVNSSGELQSPSFWGIKWCEVRGFFLHHFGTLVFVHFCVLAIAVMLHITISLKLAPCKAIKDKLSPICCWKTEALLFLILFLLPLPDTLVPFSPQLPSYGNFGPLCWFRLELIENCTVSTFDISFLHMVPFAIMCFG